MGAHLGSCGFRPSFPDGDSLGRYRDSYVREILNAHGIQDCFACSVRTSSTHLLEKQLNLILEPMMDCFPKIVLSLPIFVIFLIQNVAYNRRSRSFVPNLSRLCGVYLCQHGRTSSDNRFAPVKIAVELHLDDSHCQVVRFDVLSSVVWVLRKLCGTHNFQALQNQSNALCL